MNRSPSIAISTQEVLPPKNACCLPGQGIDPLTPQNFTLKLISASLALENRQKVGTWHPQ